MRANGLVCLVYQPAMLISLNRKEYTVEDKKRDVNIPKIDQTIFDSRCHFHTESFYFQY